MKPKKRDAPSAILQETRDAIAIEVRARVARWLDETALKPREGFLQRIEKMTATLALWGAHTNLTADASNPAEIAFHVIDSLAPIAFATGTTRETLDAALAEGGDVLDLGSGAGFPGLILAAAFGARFTLAETRRKRASYLQVAAYEMGLENVAIEQRRMSPDSIARGLYHLVTARAFGAAAELYAIAAAALRSDGNLLLYASADQVSDPGFPFTPAEHAADDTMWTYRLPHGDQVAVRTAVLRRKPRAASTDF